jgi:hypothetical protein
MPGVLRMFVLFRCLFAPMFLMLFEAEGKNLGLLGSLGSLLEE